MFCNKIIISFAILLLFSCNQSPKVYTPREVVKYRYNQVAPTNTIEIQPINPVTGLYAKDEFRVALLLPMTGDKKDIGKQVFDAVTMAIQDLNADNIKPADLLEPKQFKEIELAKLPDYENVVGQDSLTLFDDLKKNNNKSKNNRKPQHANKPAAINASEPSETITKVPQHKNPNQNKSANPNQQKPANPNQNRPQNPNQNKPKHPNQGSPKPKSNPDGDASANSNKPQHKKPVHNHKPKPKNDDLPSA